MNRAPSLCRSSPAPPRSSPTLLILLVVALAVGSGCQELKDIWGTTDEFHDAVAQRQDREHVEREAEAARVRELEERARIAGAAPRDGLGPEPDERDAKLLWLVRQRLRCDNASCSEKLLARLQGLTLVSAELLRLADQDDITVRVEAIRLIGLMDLDDAAPQVAGLLTDDSARVRKAACQALSWLKSPAGVIPIVERLRATRLPAERICLLSALSGMPGAPALKALHNAALSPSTDEAFAAIRSLSARKDPSVIPALAEALQRAESPAVKRVALDTLARIPGAAARRVLRTASRSRDPVVKEHARSLLSRQ